MIDWIIAFSISISLVLLIISIPSFINMYKMGRKKYIGNLKILYKLCYEKVDKCYLHHVTNNLSFTYPDGTISTRASDSKTYLLPIYSSRDKVFILSKKDGYLYYHLKVTEYTKLGNNWEPKEYDIDHIDCIYTMMLNKIVQNRIDKKIEFKDHIEIDSISKLNTIINSNIKSIERDRKLKEIGFNETD